MTNKRSFAVVNFWERIVQKQEGLETEVGQIFFNRHEMEEENISREEVREAIQLHK